MKKLLTLMALYLFFFPSASGQDAVGKTSLSGDPSEENETSYYLGYPTQLGDNIYEAVLFQSPDVQLIRLQYLDGKLKIRNGRMVGYNQQGDTQFVSYYRRNRLNGAWMSWFENRNLCDSGSWVKDVPDGQWKGYYPDGSERFIYHFSASRLASLKNEISRQPRIRFFAISRQPAGKAIKYYNANYALGNPVDEKTVIFPYSKMNRKKFSELALKAIIDQNTEASSSQQYIPPFRECLLHGPYTTYYPGGRIKESGIYKNGLREGLWEIYGEKDGFKSEGTYFHGQKKGEWRTYHRNGKLIRLDFYDGKGNIAESHDFKNGR